MTYYLKHRSRAEKWCSYSPRKMGWVVITPDRVMDNTGCMLDLKTMEIFFA